MDAMERELQEYHTELEQHGYANEIFSLCWDVSQIGKWYPGYKSDTTGMHYTLVDVGYLAYEAVLHTNLHGIRGSGARYLGICLESAASRHPITIVAGDGDISLAGIVQLSIIQKLMTVIKVAGMVVVQGIHLDLDRPQERHGNLPGLGYAIPICRTWIALVEGLQDFDMKAKVLPEELVVWFMLRRGEECCSLWSHDGSVQSAKAHGLTAARERSAI
ncbi:hypothetical protein EDC04DRAFT_2597654 [Pisolithus marmoratus]|nr:hypothetical protein EDC04DRAFT_2597654 [Pisolithus marmoratus]